MRNSDDTTSCEGFSKRGTKSYLIRITQRPDGLRIEVRALINGHLKVFHSFEALNAFLSDLEAKQRP